MLATGAAFLVMAAPAYAVDMAVSGVEVTQATQTPTNSLRLVARRSTAVRATLVNTDGGAVIGITGVLHVFRNGTEITPVAGVPPINAPFAAPVAPQRAVQNDTLNFELTGAATSGLTASTDVDFRVDVTPVAGETNTANNSGSANNLTVAAHTTPSIFFTRINYTPGGLGLPSDSLIQPGVGDAMVRGIFPVNDNDANLYRQGLFPSLTYSEDDGDGILEDFDPTNTEAMDLINLLASCRQLIVSNGLGPDQTTYLFGWLAGNPTDHNGRSTIPGKNAYGNTDPVRFQRTFAHEFDHLLGGTHNGATLDQVGWDVTGRLSGNPATNNTTGRVKPTSLFDIMVPAQVTNAAWTTSARYSGELTNAGLGNGPDASPDAVKRRLKRRVLFVQGAFNREGTRLIEFEPGFRYPWLAEPYAQNRRGRYQLVVNRTGSQTPITAQFDALSSEDVDGAPDLRGFWEVAVPVSGEISSIEVRAAKGRRRFASRKRSKEAPAISIVSPRAKGRLGERTRVRWTVTDADTPTAELQFQAAYSPDGGRTFVPIGVDLRGTSLTFDSSEIQKSRRRGMIRVYVSDGLNTSFADVRGLSTTAAKF
jgi:hypothetical protein